MLLARSLHRLLMAPAAGVLRGGAAAGVIINHQATSKAKLTRYPQHKAANTVRHLSYDTTVLGEPLPYETWPFHAAMIDTAQVRVADSSEFTTRLLVTIQNLREAGRSSVWLRVPILHSHLIAIAGTFGFLFHHAEKDYAMMNLWLRHPSHNKVPPYATHQVGVAGFVMNDKSEVLMVKEESKAVGWKLPGGLVDVGEEFGDAAVREVWEETGIKSKFKSILTFRHQHNMNFGRSDIYIVCRLEPLTTRIQIDPNEISEAQWVHVKTFQTAKHPILRTVGELAELAQSGQDDVDLVEVSHTSPFKGGRNFRLYHRPTPSSPKE